MAFQSFFINAFGDSTQCEELNLFLKSHIIVRTVENSICTGPNCGIQILVEYKENGILGGKSGKRIDYRATLKTEKDKEYFDKLKSFRASLAKEKKLIGAFMICKDEHLAAIVQRKNITVDEIQNLPNSSGIQIKEYASLIYEKWQNILNESNNEASDIPF